MVYQQRWDPNIPVPAPAAPNQDNNSGPAAIRGTAPMMRTDNGNFDIGQVDPNGGYRYDGTRIVSVTAMTKGQLNEAAVEVAREIKRKAIEREQMQMMLRIAKESENPMQFFNGCYNEPFLHLTETPPYMMFLTDEFVTLAGMITQLERWIVALREGSWELDALSDQVVKLGGKDIQRPTGESTVPSDVNQLKEKVAELEQRVVPTPGTPPTEEALPDEFPATIPDKPTLEDKLYDGMDPLSLLSEHRIYLLNLAAYEEAKQFNICWGIEIARSLLNQLRIAKTPGTQTEVFQSRLNALGDITFELETKGVFHD